MMTASAPLPRRSAFHLRRSEPASLSTGHSFDVDAELESVDGKLGEHLDDEDDEHNLVYSDEEAAHGLHCWRPGLEPECDSIE
jgi:hypothetical protein